MGCDPLAADQILNIIDRLVHDLEGTTVAR